MFSRARAVSRNFTATARSSSSSSSIVPSFSRTRPQSSSCPSFLFSLSRPFSSPLHTSGRAAGTPAGTGATLPKGITVTRGTAIRTRQTGTATMSTTAAAARRLEGKTIVITGASSGIGRSCAFEFARTAPRDLRLVLTARRADRLREIADQIRAEVGDGVRVLPLELDVSDPAQVRGFVDRLPDEFRDVDVLVNNAGLVKGGMYAMRLVPLLWRLVAAGMVLIAEDDMNIMFQTNVTGLINMTQAILPIFKARPDGGAGDIINIGSIAGREPYAGGSIYCATKAAVRAFTDALRKELIDTRIRVMEIDPGQVETEFSIVRYYGDKAKADAVYAGCDPLTPDDIAEVVVFVASRRQNVVVADTLVFPSHQAGAGVLYRRPT
ncbi:hypothetical protein VTH06DRAFT_6013 [Thermothelomyces fergusii]